MLSSASFVQVPNVEVPHHPERLLVWFKLGCSEDTRQVLHTVVGAVVLKTYRYVSGLQLVKVPASRLEGALADYLNSADVLYAEPNYKVFTTVCPNCLNEGNTFCPSEANDDPAKFDQLWGLHNRGQPAHCFPPRFPPSPEFPEGDAVTVSCPNGPWECNTISEPDCGTCDADIDAVEAWVGFQGDPIFRIGVIDSSLAYTHSDLEANVWGNPCEDLKANGRVDPEDFNGVDDACPEQQPNGYIDDISGYDFLFNDSDPFDDSFNSHGSHVLGSIGAAGHNTIGVVGVNWRCKIVALQCFDVTNQGSISAIVEAIDYMIANDIKISNNSWGTHDVFSTALYTAIRQLEAKGHIFVAAAGNNAWNTDVRPFFPASFDLANIISVAATDNDDNLATFSDFGATTVDLGAPGVNIYSTIFDNTPGTPRFPSYGFISGTSMATPHVTGVVALVRSYYKKLSWQQVRDRVLQTTRRSIACTPNDPNWTCAPDGKTVTGENIFVDAGYNIVGL